jgi:hypothetical protein
VQIQLQFTPTITSTLEQKEAVDAVLARRPFPDYVWTKASGEEREPPHTRWAKASFGIRVIDPDRLAQEALADVAPLVGDALADLRRDHPELGGNLRVDGSDGSLFMAVRQQDSPEQLSAAYQALPTATVSSPGAYGWDSDRQAWFRL